MSDDRQKPKRAFPLSYSKGQISNLALGVVTTIVTLFVGLFMIDSVSEIQSESSLYDYAYTTVNNTTTGSINTSVTLTHQVSIGDIVSIEDEAAARRTIDVFVTNNTAHPDNINVTLNGESLGTFALGNSATTLQRFDNVGWIKNTINNITVGTVNTTNSFVTVNYTTSAYASGKTNTNIGNVFTNLTTSTGAVYDVITLVVIIFALGMAIGVLSRFTGGPSAPVAV